MNLPFLSNFMMRSFAPSPWPSATKMSPFLPTTTSDGELNSLGPFLRHHRKVARKLLPTLLIALNVSCGAGPPDQTRASGPPRQDIDFEQAPRQMVEEQIGARGVTDSRVLEAMLRVPRHEYVPLEYRVFAYSDTPLPIGLAQTISQPYIVALMTELIQPEAGRPPTGDRDRLRVPGSRCGRLGLRGLQY